MGIVKAVPLEEGTEVSPLPQRSRPAAFRRGPASRSAALRWSGKVELDLSVCTDVSVFLDFLILNNHRRNFGRVQITLDTSIQRLRSVSVDRVKIKVDSKSL